MNTERHRWSGPRRARPSGGYGRSRPSCTAGRVRIQVADSVMRSTLSMTPRSCSLRCTGCGATGVLGRLVWTEPAPSTSSSGTECGLSWPISGSRWRRRRSGRCGSRERMIPKADGKQRRLGIATVRDRVVQVALKQVLEPIWETDFLPCAYGFRPKRRAHDAIAEIRTFASAPHRIRVGAGGRNRGVPRLDLPRRTARVRERITDRRVVALIKAFLKAGIFNTETGHGTRRREPRKAEFLSPLLANIALSVLDEHFQVGGARTGLETNQTRDRGPRPTVRRRSAVGRGGRGVAADGFAPVGCQDPDQPPRRWIRTSSAGPSSVAVSKGDQAGKDYVYTYQSKKSLACGSGA